MKISKFISYFFHPINFPIVGAVIYFLFLPKFIYKPQEYTILFIIFIGTYLFPLVLLALLKHFKMIHSYHLKTIDERKFPMLLFISISFIMGHWLYKSSLVDLLSLLYFGYGLGLFLAYVLLYYKIKISLHTVAISGLVGFLICFSYYYKINMILLLVVCFIMSGLIASSRLKLLAHNFNEVILGFVFGIFSQFIVFLIYMM